MESPAKALPLLSGLPTLAELFRWIKEPVPPGKPPLASDLASWAASVKGALGAGVSYADPELSPARRGKKREPYPELPPAQAFAADVPLGVILHQGVRRALFRALAENVRAPVRSALPGPLPVCWYGQHDASWIAYYDVLLRLRLAAYPPSAAAGLAHWAALARSCGWWWPGEDVCVVTERSATLTTEPLPHARHDEVRATHVTYRDGWSPF